MQKFNKALLNQYVCLLSMYYLDKKQQTLGVWNDGNLHGAILLYKTIGFVHAYDH